jgi:hypothetical protein
MYSTTTRSTDISIPTQHIRTPIVYDIPVPVPIVYDIPVPVPIVYDIPVPVPVPIVYDIPSVPRLLSLHYTALPCLCLAFL